MDHLIGSIEKLFPILIFIFWIIVSLFANARKQRNKQIPPGPTRTEPRTTSYEQQPGTTDYEDYDTEDEPRSSTTASDLKRQLETIFGDQQAEKTNENYDEEVEQPAASNSNTTLETEAEKPPVETVRAAPATNYMSISSMPDSSLSLSLSEIYEREIEDRETTGPALDISIDDLRKAVIWSEIIAPPLALRESTQTSCQS